LDRAKRAWYFAGSRKWGESERQGDLKQQSVAIGSGIESVRRISCAELLSLTHVGISGRSKELGDLLKSSVKKVGTRTVFVLEAWERPVWRERGGLLPR
jgi:hypothetical protein